MGMLYKLPLRKRVIRWCWPLIKVGSKFLVLLCAIRGKYPWPLLTPDDPVSPFGCGTSGGDVEPTVQKVYAKFGRYIGDIYWLGWRNSNYGLAYWLKPDWLKDPNIKYEDLIVGYTSGGMYTVLQPDGTLLWERNRKVGPFTLITGFRVAPIVEGALENRCRLAAGGPRAPRPARHPNMDGRPIVSLRTRRTL